MPQKNLHSNIKVNFTQIKRLCIIFNNNCEKNKTIKALMNNIKKFEIFSKKKDAYKKSYFLSWYMENQCNIETYVYN